VSRWTSRKSTPHFADVYRYVLSLCGDSAVAEEITQETFFKAIRSIDQFNGSCKLYVWLCQIAKNTYFTHSRKQSKVIPAAEIEVDGGVPDIEASYLEKDTARRLHIHLHSMEEPYKEVFTLRVFGELGFTSSGFLCNLSQILYEQNKGGNVIAGFYYPEAA